MKINGSVQSNYIKNNVKTEPRKNDNPRDGISLNNRTSSLQNKISRLRQLAFTSKVKDKKSYAPEGRYLWDSWILKDDTADPPCYRLFHLDAPDNGDPESRHHIASVRQAVSTDLKNWKDLGPTLEPGKKGEWDDKAIWTGNVYKKENGEYLFFYTGRNERDDQIQRIGLARSEDGINWKKEEKPILEPDGRWYETDEPSPIYKAWRDPEIVKDEKSGKYLMYFTAKTKDGDEKYKGCIGLAQADNLEGPYEALPPVLAPGKYAQMEVPQIIKRNDKVYLFFSSMEKDYNPEWADKIGGPQCGLHAYVGDSLKGPFKPLNGDGVITGSKDNLYTVKFLEDPENPDEFVAMGWYMEDKDGQKGFTLSKPLPVKWEGDNISIETGMKE
ncbi:MAG: glycoside hydrolase family 68 protein [Vulcanimicrobiota bacterium]